MSQKGNKTPSNVKRDVRKINKKINEITSDNDSPIRVPTQKVGRTIMKWTCFECNICAFVSNFGVNSYSELSRTSTCSFCKLKKLLKVEIADAKAIQIMNGGASDKEIEILKKDVIAMRRELSECKNEIEMHKTQANIYKYKIFNLEKEICRQRDVLRPTEVLEVGNKISSLEHEVKMMKANNKRIDKSEEKEETFIRVTGKRASKKRIVQEPMGIATSNKYQELELLELEEETILIGDSLIRDQGSKFALRNPQKRVVICHPGAQIFTVSDHVKKLKLK